MMSFGSMRRAVLPCTVIAAIASSAGAAVDVDIPAKLLADTTPGSASGMASTATFAASGGEAFFRATSNGAFQLWRSNGRVRGTFAVPGSSGIATDPVAIPGAPAVLYYTGAGTLRPLNSYDLVSKQVIAISPTAMPAISTGLQSPTGGVPTGGFAFANGHAFFIAPVSGVNTLWSTDGTAAGTTPVADTAAGMIGNITPAGQYVYFTMRTTANVYSLWRTSGVAGSTVRVADLRSAPTWQTDSSGMRGVGNRVLFGQTVPGYVGYTDVWVSDGTTVGTHSVAQIPSPNVVLPFVLDGTGVYSTRLTSTAMEMWRMAPAAADCVNLMNFARSTQFTGFGSFGSMSVFGDSGGSQYNQTTNNAITIWVTDGSGGNTLGIPNFPGVPASGSGSTQIGALTSVMSGSTLYLVSNVGGNGHEPWKMNLATGAVGVLRDILPGGAASNPTRFFPMDNSGAGFFAYDVPGHYALYTSNGESGGTRLVSRLGGVAYQFSPRAVGSRIFLIGGMTNGYEPYVVDTCPGDYDNSGTATTQDLFAYLNDWFNMSPDADIDAVVGDPNLADLMQFFNDWMTPCVN